MTGTTRSSDGLSDQRKRLLFRCWHRGTREMDLILGRFADAHIASLTDVELDDLERLGELPDPVLYEMLSGASDIPADLAQGLLPRIKAFGAPDPDA
jgi:antitoxin CptB